MTNPLPLLLLPGLMCDERVWDPIRAALPGRPNVVVSLTDSADHVDTLAAAAIQAMPPGPFALAGFSLGGYVALAVCRQARERIAGIALLDTGARADTAESTQNRQRMVAALASGTDSFAAIAAGFAARLLHPAHAQDAALTTLLADMARVIGAEGFVRQQTAAMSRPDQRDLLPLLRCPALVLYGAQDQVTPPPLSEEMAGLLGGEVERVLVEQCGHLSTLEQPVAVRAAFTRWIARVDAAAAASH